MAFLTFHNGIAYYIISGVYFFLQNFPLSNTCRNCFLYASTGITAGNRDSVNQSFLTDAVSVIEKIHVFHLNCVLLCSVAAW